MEEITKSPISDLLALLSAPMNKAEPKNQEGQMMFEQLFQQVMGEGVQLQGEQPPTETLQKEEGKKEEDSSLLKEGEEILLTPEFENIQKIEKENSSSQRENLDEKNSETVDLLMAQWVLPVQSKQTEAKESSPIHTATTNGNMTKGTISLPSLETGNEERRESLAERSRQAVKRDVGQELLQDITKTTDSITSTTNASKIVTADGQSLSAPSTSTDVKSTNPALPYRETIMSTIRKEVGFEFSSVIKTLQADKIVIQLKPLELGLVEVTVEQVDGELMLKLKSDNKDVQELLDGMAEEIQDEWKQRSVKELDEADTQPDKEGKTKEEILESEKQYEEEEVDISFEELLTEWIGGQTNGWNNRYYQ